MDDYFPEAYGLAQAAGQLRGRNASLKRQLSEAQETIENWQDYAGELEKKLRGMQEQISKAERNAANAQRAADNAQRKASATEGTWMSIQASDKSRYRQLQGRYDDLLAQLSAFQATVAARDEALDLTKRELELTKRRLARSLSNQEYFRHQANLGLAHEAGLAAAISVLVEALKETSPLYEETCIGVDTPEGHEPARIEVSARQARAAAIAEMDLPETHLAQLMAERDDAPELPFTWDEAKSPS